MLKSILSEKLLSAEVDARGGNDAGKADASELSVAY